MPDTTDPQTDTDRRDRYAQAIREATGERWPAQAYWTEADAVIAVADAEQAELRRERDEWETTAYRHAKLWRTEQGRRVADEEQQPETQPRRGDAFEQWLKAQRDLCFGHASTWGAVDGLLDQYRLHADTGTPLGEHVCEGQAVGDCECLEKPAVAQPKQPPMDPVHILGIGVLRCDHCKQPGHSFEDCPHADAPAVVAEPGKEA